MALSPLSVELCSWKEIASYLGVSVKTAQVWEATRGLPVRRLPGPRVQVRAVVAELELWKTSAAPTAEPASAPEPPLPIRVPERAGAEPARLIGFPGLRVRLWVLGVGLVVVGVFVALGMGLRRPVVSSVSVVRDALVGFDGRGTALWRHDFGSLRPDAYTNGDRRSWVGDLGGERVVLFVPTPAGLVDNSVPLVCLDTAGGERWRFDPGKTVQHSDDVFRAPFVVRQFAIIGEHILVTSHHRLYYPSQVAVLDHDGKILREYWHPGHLNVLSTGKFQGKPVAFLGGVNNHRHRATIVVLDPERLTGAAIEGDKPFFTTMPAAVEEARLLFPRSTITTHDPYNVVVQTFSQNDEVIVDVQERLSGTNPPSIQYHLDQRLDLKQVILSDIFLSAYRQQTKHDVTPKDNANLQRITRIP